MDQTPTEQKYVQQRFRVIQFDFNARFTFFQRWNKWNSQKKTTERNEVFRFCFNKWYSRMLKELTVTVRISIYNKQNFLKINLHMNY